MCATIAGCDLFGSESEVRVVIPDADREYEPLDPVVFHVINATADTIFDDRCRGELQGLATKPGQWSGSYGAARGCLDPGQPSGPVAERLEPIPPGATKVDTFHINYYAYTGSWRVELQLFSSDTIRLPPESRISNEVHANGRHDPPSSLK